MATAARTQNNTMAMAPNTIASACSPASGEPSERSVIVSAARAIDGAAANRPEKLFGCTTHRSARTRRRRRRRRGPWPERSRCLPSARLPGGVRARKPRRAHRLAADLLVRASLRSFPVPDDADEAAARHDLDLARGEAVAHEVCLALGLVHDLDAFTSAELLSRLGDREDVPLVDAVVVAGIRERQRQHGEVHEVLPVD